MTNGMSARAFTLREHSSSMGRTYLQKGTPYVPKPMQRVLPEGPDLTEYMQKP